MDTPVKSIRIKNVHKSYRTVMGTNHVLRGVNLRIPQNKSIGILGRNGAGKSTLINIISKKIMPDRGSVEFNDLRISWPIGGGAFQGSLSALDNVKFICRATDTPFEETIEFIEDFSELGEYLYMPIKTYSSGMKSRLAFAVNMSMDYDCLLVDEGFNAGDARFTRKMQDLFEEKRGQINMICVSHNARVIRKFCDYAAILDKGKITVYDDLSEALALYKNL